MDLPAANAVLTARVQLLGVIAEESCALLQAPDVFGAIYQTLRRVGEAAGLSRVLYLEGRPRSGGPVGMRDHQVRLEWCALGVPGHAALGMTAIPHEAADAYAAAGRRGQSVWMHTADLDPAARAALAPLAVLALGCAPVFVDGAYFGCVAFEDCVTARAWEIAQVDSLTAAANVIGAAIQGHQTRERLAADRECAARECVAELGQANVALRSTLERLVGPDDLPAFLGHCLGVVVEMAGAASGYLYRYEPASHTLRATLAVRGGQLSAHGFPDDPPEFRAGVPADITGAWRQMVTSGEAAFHLTDVPDSLVWPFTVEWHRRLGHTAHLSLALADARGPLGMLGLAFTDRRAVSAGQRELIAALGNQITLALELDKLAAEARRGAVLAERSRLSRDLHDTLSQGFAGVLAQLGGAIGALDAGETETLRRCLERATVAARASLQEARRAVHALRPGFLEADTPLLSALEEVLAQMTSGTALRSRLRVAGTVRPLPAKWIEALVRIVQELLANTLHHTAQSAREFVLDVGWSERTFRLEARDDGLGFDPGQTTDGFGLVGIRERVQALGGRFQLNASPGRGTAVTVELPLDQHASGVRAASSESSS